MLRNFIVLLLCLFSFKLSAVSGRLCLEHYTEFHNSIKSDHIEYKKYERIVDFITHLDQLTKLIFNDQQIPNKYAFEDHVKYYPLENYPQYNNFIISKHYQSFKNNKYESDRRIVEMLLFEYLFGSLLCGQTLSRFSPITFLYFKTHFNIPRCGFPGIH